MANRSLTHPTIIASRRRCYVPTVRTVRTTLGGARAVAGGVAAAVVLCASLTACTPRPPLDAHDFRLAGTLSNAHMPLPDDAISSLRLVTPYVCGAEVPCLEAWDSSLGEFRRFASIEEATAFVEQVGDAEQDRYVVIDFSGLDVSESERSNVIGTVFAQLPQEGGPFSIFGG